MKRFLRPGFRKHDQIGWEVLSMLCQSCGVHPATTRIKTIVNGRLTERALCASCAQRLGYVTLFTQLNRGFGSVFSDFLEEAQPGEERCPQCGATFDEIARTGQVGCARCYEVFHERLEPIIQHMYGGDIHCGKMPGENLPQPQQQAQITVMDEALRQAVAEENQESRQALLHESLRRLGGGNTDA